MVGTFAMFLMSYYSVLHTLQTTTVGTGKTESVKALGGLMGRQVLVFNCDEVRG